MDGTKHNVVTYRLQNKHQITGYISPQNLVDKVQTVMVNESGASIYSASDVAREEFPDHDVTVRELSTSYSNCNLCSD